MIGRMWPMRIRRFADHMTIYMFSAVRTRTTHRLHRPCWTGQADLGHPVSRQRLWRCTTRTQQPTADDGIRLLRQAGKRTIQCANQLFYHRYAGGRSEVQSVYSELLNHLRDSVPICNAMEQSLSANPVDTGCDECGE